jgi:Tfp pilus assembly protein PilN
MIEMIDLFMQWLVAPIVVVVWVLFNKVTKNDKDIAVLQSQHEANKVSHDREMKEMKETIKAIFIKLDTIEQALRHK